MKDKMTFRQKLENYWYYYKIHTIVGIFLIIVAVFTIREITAKIDYDYSVAVMTAEYMTDEVQGELQQVFNSIGEDINGNGRVDVELLVYLLGDAESANPNQTMANQTRFMADLQMGSSMVFLFDPKIGEIYKDDGFLQTADGLPIPLSQCGAYQKANIAQLENYLVTLRVLEGSGLEKKESTAEYYRQSKELLERFIASEGN